MILSDRQKDILNKAVFEYIDQAQPVSSRWLEERYKMEVSPATIRSELVVLTEEGFLLQRHASSGRVPSDKGYRFFVDEISRTEQELRQDALVMLKRHVRDYMRTMQMITKVLAVASSNLIIAYIPNRNLVWKEGWEEVLKAPEFEERDQLRSFTRFLADLERSIQKFHARKALDIYIGNENPFSVEKDFSIMISVYPISRNQSGMVGIVGPKRMAYERNMGLLNHLHKVFT